MLIDAHKTATFTLTTFHAAQLTFEAPSRTGWTLHEETVTGADPMHAAERLLAQHGMWFVTGWRVDLTSPRTTRAGIGVVEPVPWGPDLLRRAEQHHSDIAAAVALRRRGGGVPASQAPSLEPFCEWFAEAVDDHPWWPWAAVDGAPVARAAVETALIHPDEAFRRTCYTMMNTARAAGQIDEDAALAVASSAYDYDL